MNDLDHLREVIKRVCDNAGGDRDAAYRRLMMVASVDSRIMAGAYEGIVDEVARQLMLDRPDLADDLPALAAETERRLPDEFRRRAREWRNGPGVRPKKTKRR